MNNGIFILVACFPKSGSTYLSNLISAIPTFSKVCLVPSYEYREQEICKYEAIKYYGKNVCAQHHVIYNSNTDFVIKMFNIRPIVLVRNIFDCVVSCGDHLINEHYSSYYNKYNDKTTRYHMIIDTLIPWHFKFYTTWSNSNYNQNIVSYEDIYQSLDGMKNLINNFIPEIKIDRKNVAILNDLIKEKYNRKNIGISGRGNIQLNDEHKHKIVKMMRYYKCNNFDKIGLSKSIISQFN